MFESLINIMTGRKFKDLIEIWHQIFMTMINGLKIPLIEIKIRCPECGSWMVGPNGTRKRKDGRVDAFICKNPECKNKGRKTPKQFIVTSSYEFKKLVHAKLKQLYEDMLKDGAKNKTIAKKYNVSPSEISALRTEIEKAIGKHQTLNSLVDVPQPDKAIAIDETFLKIEGKKVYIIVATGYTTRKVLGVKVSYSRKEQDMREVFDEAEKNTMYPIKTVISDAWTSTIAMVKHLGREISHVIHKHKKPYKKAVIKHYHYTDTERVTTTIGVKTDIMKRRATRQGHYVVKREPLNVPLPKKVGRPKGSKTKKNHKRSSKKKKRGRKGLFKVFDKGKKFFFKVDPYRKTIRGSKHLPATVQATLAEVLELFALKSIQNNVSENLNSVLQSLLRLRGPKTVDSVEQRIRAFLIVRNTPEILKEIEIERNVRGKFFKDNITSMEFSNLVNGGWTV
ncbi:MAG: DDE-type integrase/transposase/recombinase [Candidatus Lokiarchaeota archaeon]|nr:DDE-type integrase/transposase/recombinase [Candidatus Lokiarchaeota archaeon]